VVVVVLARARFLRHRPPNSSSYLQNISEISS
jgi:hypothetical protein